MAADMDIVSRRRLRALLARLEVAVLDVEHDVRPCDVRFPLVTQDFHKLYCIYAGRGTHQAAGAAMAVGAGDLVYVPPGVTHVDNPVGRRTYSKIFCHFAARSGGIALADFLTLPPVIRIGRGFAAARRLFGELHREHHADGCASALRADARLRDILALVIDAAPPAQVAFRWSPTLTRLDRVIRVLTADLRRAHRLEDLARVAGVHPSHLCRVFTAGVGMPPHQYLMRLRLRRAQELLRTTAEPVEAIATRTGFASLPHFTRTFSRAFSIPPSHWRKVALAAP